MTQSTQPVNGLALTFARWGGIFADGNGIAFDAVGDAGALTLAGDTATVAPLSYRWKGAVLTVDAPVAFTIPSTAGTYVVGVVATDADKGTSWLSVQCGPSGFSPPSSGVLVRKLWEFVRAPSTPLSSSTVVFDRRVWVGDTLASNSLDALPADAPRGSSAMVGKARFRRVPSGGGLVWSDHEDLPWLIPGALAPETGTVTAQLRDGAVTLFGNLRRTNGSPLPYAGVDVILATFPKAWGPEFAQRYVQCTEQRGVYAEVVADDNGTGDNSGRLLIIAPRAEDTGFKRVHLSGISWRPQGPL